MVDNYPAAAGRIREMWLGLPAECVQKVPDEGIRHPICVYTSSPDRGWERLNGVWPEIRKRVPRARLVIPYKPEGTWKTDNLTMENGVKFLGFVPADSMPSVLLQSRVVVYPIQETHRETFCIGVYKAQAFGCVPSVI